jgi:ribosomal protein L7/L12
MTTDNLLQTIADLIEERKNLQANLLGMEASFNKARRESDDCEDRIDNLQNNYKLLLKEHRQCKEEYDALKNAYEVAYTDAQRKQEELQEKLDAAEKNSLRPTTNLVVNSRPGSAYYESLKDCWRLNSPNRPMKIPAIKRMRTFTGAGLKEAKETVEALWMKWDVEAAKKDTEGPLEF